VNLQWALGTKGSGAPVHFHNTAWNQVCQWSSWLVMALVMAVVVGSTGSGWAVFCGDRCYDRCQWSSWCWPSVVCRWC
jgi:hypothetical protein